MDEQLARLESAVADLTGRVAELEARLATAHSADASFSHRYQPSRDPLAAVGELGAAPVQHWLALIGRTLVVLGGAYLLRAITESHMVAPQVGVALGLLYGAPWLLLESRAAARGAQLDALCHALSTALIGYPLVWEATVRFQVLTPAQSAGLLAALTGAALVLSSRRQLQSLAWVVTFGALGSAVGLAAATSAWVPYTLLAIGVGIATLWLGYTHSWVEMRWPAAFVANFMLFIATGRAGAHGGIASVLWLQVVMLAGYFGSFAARTLIRAHRLVVFEGVQSAAALAVGFGGLIYLLAPSRAIEVVAAASLVISAGMYAAAFRISERHRPAANFFFHAMLGFFFAIAGLAIGFSAAVAACSYALIAGVTLGLARRRDSLTLALHATMYALAAGIASGLLTGATLAIVTPGPDGVAPPALVPMAALAALLAIAVLPLSSTRERWPYVLPTSRCLLALAATWALAGTAVALALVLLPGPVDPSLLSTVRTMVLVAAAVAVASAGRYAAGREAAWLTYPLLLVAGMKLVFVDFMQGRPTTLFAALAVYGTALIVAPRLLRQSSRAPEVVVSPPAMAAVGPHVGRGL